MKKFMSKAMALTLAVLLSVAFVPFFSGTAKADTGDFEYSDDGFVYMLDSDLGGYDIVSYSGDPVVHIQAYFNGIRVKNIEPGTFGVNYMFAPDNTQITSVAFPTLTAAELSAGGPITVGSSALAGQPQLTSVDLADSALLSGDRQFEGDTSLSVINCADDSPHYAIVGGVLFSQDLSDLIQYPPARKGASYEIPSGVTALEKGCFEDCRSLTSVSFPDGLDGVSGDLFMGCADLSEIDTTNPAYLTDSGVLFNAAKTTLVCFPPAKAGSYTIPDTVTAFAPAAFDAASGVTAVAIPQVLTDFGTDPSSSKFENPFEGCPSLAAITVAAGNSDWKVVDGVLFSGDGKTLVAYPPARAATESSHYSKFTPPAITASKGSFGNTAAQVLRTMPKGLPESAYKSAFTAAAKSAAKPSGSKAVSSAVTSGVHMDGLYTVPNDVTTIASGAFSHTTLTIVAFNQDSVISNISDFAFPAGSVSLSAVPEAASYTYVKAYASGSGIPFIEGKPSQDGFTYSVSGGKATITGYEGDETNLTIPDHVTSNGGTSYDVTAIGDGAFAQSGIIHIAIPDTVTKIGKEAFLGCMDLTGVLKVPANVTEIGEGCFAICMQLTGVVLPEGLDKLDDGMFYECRSLQSVDIPSTVTALGDSCFASCPIKEITIPAGVTALGIGCFSGCESLAAITLPDGLTELQDGTFSGCGGLKSVTFGAGSKITRIGESCFAGSGITSLVIPSLVDTIGPDCFDSCTALETVTLPGSLGLLDKDTFLNCIALKNIAIPSSVSTIGEDCFQYCSSLENVTIPKSVVTIDSGAFMYCDSLQYFNVAVDNGDFQSSVDGVLFNKTKDGAATELIAYPSGKADTAYEIPASVITVDSGAFSGPVTAALTSVTMHGAVASADDAFAADSLQHIYVDGDNIHYANYTVNSVNDGVLYNKARTQIICYPLSKADKVYDLPATMTALSSPTLCWRLFETVNIPAGLTDFEYDEEYGGGGDEGEVKSAYDFSGIDAPGIFSYCPNLLNIYVDPANPLYTSVNGVVYGNKAKTSILFFPTGRKGDYTIPAGVTTINDYAFFGASLSRVFFMASNMKLGSGAFAEGALTAAVFYGNPYVFNWDESEYGPFDYEPNAFKVYYHIIKQTTWIKFNDAEDDPYPSQAFCTLTLNFQDGRANQQLMEPISSGHVAAPADPTRSGCAFADWYKEAACTHQWDFTTGIAKSDFTLYARWMSDAPATVSASEHDYSSIDVSWITVANAAGYEISRATSPTGRYQVIGTAKASATKFTNKSVTTGTPYYYKVRAFTQAGRNKFYGNYSTPASATANLKTPDAPKAQTASYKSVKVSWNKVAGATKYILYRASSADPTNYKAIKTTSSRSYTDNGAMIGTYYYKVQAVRGKAVSPQSAASASVTTALSKPTHVKPVRASATAIKITWKAVDGASGYEVWQSSSVDSTFVQAGTATRTSYTAAGLTLGVTYSYEVRAYRVVNGVKVYGSYSDVASPPLYVASTSPLPYTYISTSDHLLLHCNGGESEMSSVKIVSIKDKAGQVWIGVIPDLNAGNSVSYPLLPGLNITLENKDSGKVLFYYIAE